MPMSYCEINSAIAGFYVTELDRFTKSQQSGGIIHDAHEKFFLKRIVRMSNIIEAFGVNTCLGEMRHILRGPSMTLAYNSDCKETRAIKKFYSLNLAPSDYSDVRYGARDVIYSKRIAPNMVVPLMNTCEHLYRNFEWGHHGYGGKKWADICEQIVKVHETLERCWSDGPFSDIVLSVDRLVNLCHNTGAFLNKYDCGSAKFIHPLRGLVGIDGVLQTLEAHKNGDLEHLRGLASTMTCVNAPCQIRLSSEDTEGDDDVLRILGKKVQSPAVREVREARSPAPEFA